MKLATLQNGQRDGRLAVVNRTLTQAVWAPAPYLTLQLALDDWQQASPILTALSQQLEAGALASFAFASEACLAPLPRAYQWADGSAYVNHVELVRRARGATMPDTFWTDPLMYQGGSDDLLGPRAPIVCPQVDYGIDFEAELAVITDDVPMTCPPADAASHIKLIMLVNDVSLRNLIPPELAKGFGFFQSKPASAFSPVAVTPDELGEAWQDCKVHLPLYVHWNGQQVCQANAGVDMVFNFAQLIAHVAKTRRLGAGSIIGSGTVSNTDRRQGYACIAEQRALEMIEYGAPRTPYLQYGDTVQIEMCDARGQSIFGRIEQVVQPLGQ
ncbi:fumarylacetoacetate hydrolase family protein [Parvibium lacunae]|uniref:FAA hydrolase family protein n=1 Tax=Parvibium lacunae TaxID=1888893 RepID=A0A368L0J8_9BURK|nr:fumarylacetoacetate hydrolase family protein [Parvibium lacunae]RCS57088.1 FAA hydrolase family protein [Parvibium lacunae]